MSIQKTTAIVYKVNPNKSGWADITLEEWRKGGSLKIISDWGDWAYSWGSIGERGLRSFLSELNYGYLFGKLDPLNSGLTFDKKASIKNIRKDILRHRREGNIISFWGRKLWDRMAYFDQAHDEHQFIDFLGKSEILEVIYGGDYHSVPMADTRDPHCDRFWEGPWKEVCELWREEMRRNEALEQGVYQ